MRRTYLGGRELKGSKPYIHKNKKNQYMVFQRVLNSRGELMFYNTGYAIKRSKTFQTEKEAKEHVAQWNEKEKPLIVGREVDPNYQPIMGGNNSKRSFIKKKLFGTEVNKPKQFTLGENERWVKGYKGLYCADKKGNVYSLHTGNKKRLKPEKDGNNLWLRLYKNKKRSKRKLQDIVFGAFNPNIVYGFIYFKNGNRWNCSLDNLGYTSPKEVKNGNGKT